MSSMMDGGRRQSRKVPQLRFICICHCRWSACILVRARDYCWCMIWLSKRESENSTTQNAFVFVLFLLPFKRENRNTHHVADKCEFDRPIRCHKKYQHNTLKAFAKTTVAIWFITTGARGRKKWIRFFSFDRIISAIRTLKSCVYTFILSLWNKANRVARSRQLDGEQKKWHTKHRAKEL